jgi:hypothetical protein
VLDITLVADAIGVSDPNVAAASITSIFVLPVAGTKTGTGFPFLSTGKGDV